MFLVIGGGRVLGVLKIDGVGPDEARARHVGKCECSGPDALISQNDGRCKDRRCGQNGRMVRVTIVFVKKWER
jgi:hypothetical protein